MNDEQYRAQQTINRINERSRKRRDSENNLMFAAAGLLLCITVASAVSLLRSEPKYQRPVFPEDVQAVREAAAHQGLQITPAMAEEAARVLRAYAEATGETE
jgi:hypothetical protein